MDKDTYFLIANHLRDIHNTLESKILESRTRSPKWTVTRINDTITMVVELSQIIGIATLLEKLAGGQEQQSFSIVSPGQEEE